MGLKNPDGTPLKSQRDLEKELNLSRPYLRKLAKEIGHQFPRNGIEVAGVVCICENCGVSFTKNPSRVERCEKDFCSEECRQEWMKGSNHPSWQGGKTASSFSKWVVSTAAWKELRERALEREGHRCIVSGISDKEESLHMHHLQHKQEELNPEKTFDLSNVVMVTAKVHRQIHKLTSQGKTPIEAVQILKEEYGTKNL